MRRSAYFAGFLVLFSLLGSLAAQAQSSLRLTRHVIMDEQGPFGRMPAASTLIPAGWKTSGGVVWHPPAACLKGPRIQWGASSPDDSYSMFFMPDFTWGVNANGAPMGCVQQNFTSADQALQYFLQTQAQSLSPRVLSVDRPQWLGPVLQQQMQQLAQAPGVQQWGDAVAATVRINQNGRDLDSLIIMVTYHNVMQIQDPWGGYQQSAWGGILAFFTFTTPPGQLDRENPAFTAILQNFRSNPQWDQQVAQWWARLRGSLAPRGGGSPGAGGSSKSVGDIIHEGYMARSGMTDRGQRETIEGVWGVETYATPDGDLSFSNQYNHVWRLDNGDYALTNDESFAPFRDLGLDGAEMQVAN